MQIDKSEVYSEVKEVELCRIGWYEKSKSDKKVIQYIEERD